MKAIVQNAYGSPDVLELQDIDKPKVGDGDVLVRVHAAGVNAGDYFTMSGSPWLVRMVVGVPETEGLRPWMGRGRACRGGRHEGDAIPPRR